MSTPVEPRARGGRLFPGIVLLVLLAGGLFYQSSLKRWFGGADDPAAKEPAAGASPDAGSQPATQAGGPAQLAESAIPAHELSPAALEQVTGAFASYEAVTTLLAADRLDGMDAEALRVGEALQQAA